MSREILNHYLLSQTSITEYLPRNKIPKVTNLPPSTHDPLYAELARIDQETRAGVEADIRDFTTKLYPLIHQAMQQAEDQQKVIEDVKNDQHEQHQQGGDNQKQTANDMLFGPDSSRGTIMDSGKLDELKLAVTRELQARNQAVKKEQEKTIHEISNIANQLSKRQIDVAYDFEPTVKRSVKRLNTLETRISKTLDS